MNPKVEPGPSNLSVIMPTRNVGKIIAGALNSVSWADEIIIVDDFSEDDTVAQCRAFPNCKVYERRAPGGNFDLNRQFAEEQAQGPWILKLDSDERIPGVLRDEIRRTVGSWDGETAAYYFPARVYIFGKQIKWGIFKKAGEKDLRLWRKGKVYQKPIGFHISYQISGPTKVLENHYNHFNYKSIGQWYEKMNHYTEIEANLAYARGDLETPPPWRMALHALKYFYELYIRFRGYRDGFQGFLDAFLRAEYDFIESAKKWEARYKIENGLGVDPDIDKIFMDGSGKAQLIADDSDKCQ
jgi:glycosyltransferase involved in cell wall biosynthesis